MSVLKQLTAQIEATGDFKKPAQAALKIITMSKNVLASKGVVTGVEIGNIGEEVKSWDSGDEYRDASMLAIPHWKAEEFSTALKNGNFKEALNCSFYFRLDADSPLYYGDIVSFKLSEYTNANGEIGLNIRNIKTEIVAKQSVSLTMFGAPVEVEETSDAAGM